MRSAWPLALLALGGTLQPLPSRATNPPKGTGGREREKAAFVLELTRFVEWPARALPDAGAPFVVGVLGDEPFAAALAAELAGRRAGNRPIEIRSFRNLDEVEPSPILYVGEVKARLMPVVVEFLGPASVLTIGELEGFLERGGILRWIERPDRIAFEVDRRRAEAVGLRLSAELLHLAERVLPEPEESRAP